MAPMSEGDKISHYEKEQDQYVGFQPGIGLPASLFIMCYDTHSEFSSFPTHCGLV